MIESEIAILSSVSHPHVIQLEEVFDFAAEKYLIMEYVPVGGWLVGRSIQVERLIDEIILMIKFFLIVHFLYYRVEICLMLLLLILNIPNL